MSLMASFYAVLFPRDVLDEIWDFIESVSEGFSSYSFSYLFVPVCSFFFIHTTFIVKENSTTIQDRKIIFGIQVDINNLYRRIKNGFSSICSSLYLLRRPDID